ncbi:MAG: NADH-quinone oxidoreductase subunit C [Nitrospinota bacterium]|nr:NADH-quinone oxidoreductase subunit C [Nitrospinota bacterium]
MGAITQIIKEKFPDVVVGAHEQHGDETVTIKKERVLEVMHFLRDDERTAFNFLMDLTAVDYFGKTPRFEVVYHLYSLGKNHRVRIKAQVAEDDCSINSLVPIWIGADWYEREVWDLYGIAFKGHPNMKRLLLYEEFVGHPLRKDYPIDKRQPLIGPEN